jgi:hypothetical protein
VCTDVNETARESGNISLHGWHNITVYAINSSNYTLSTTGIDIQYQRPNNVPSFVINNKSVYVGQDLNFSIGAVDGDGDNISYASNASIGTSTFNATTGTFSLSPVLVGDVGNYSVYFNASDAYGGSLNQTIMIRVKASRTISTYYYPGWQIAFVNASANFSTLNTFFAPSTYMTIWDSATQAWHKYKSGWSYRQTEVVSTDQAVQVLFTAGVTKSMTISTPMNWTLAAGMNMIGVSLNMTLSEINASVNNEVGCENVDEITYTYPNNSTQVTYSCALNSTQANAGVPVEAGRGVWMNALRTVNIQNVAE